MPARLLLAVSAVSLLCSALTAPAQDFPDGPGKQTFTTYCGACHDINRVRAGYTPEGWRTVVRMMQNLDVPVPQNEWATLTEYLTKSFPERAKPAANVIEGPAQVAIKLWPVATPGSRPHDPATAPDGSIWYTGQMTNKLGRVDPKTNEVKEYTLKIPHSAPHGIMADKDGNMWFTANGGAYVGKLDPKTGDVTEYKMPDPEAKDPHSLAIDRNGTVWFTVQNGNMMGRVDPKSGEVKLVTSPTPRSRPYGIMINSKGVPVVVLFGTNKVATIDPQTMAIKEYTLPNAASRPRRLVITGDDAVWYTDFPRGFLGRLDLATGDVKEWPSPGGPKSEPYGIILAKDIIWYSESGTKPNTIVRFDPKTEKFQTWVIPGGGDIVRNMDVTQDGNPLLANSLVNQVGIVEVK
jgi:virginiamycin B lyase